MFGRLPFLDVETPHEKAIQVYTSNPIEMKLKKTAVHFVSCHEQLLNTNRRPVGHVNKTNCKLLVSCKVTLSFNVVEQYFDLQ